MSGARWLVAGALALAVGAVALRREVAAPAAPAAAIASEPQPEASPRVPPPAGRARALIDELRARPPRATPAVLDERAAAIDAAMHQRGDALALELADQPPLPPALTPDQLQPRRDVIDALPPPPVPGREAPPTRRRHAGD